MAKLQEQITAYKEQLEKVKKRTTNLQGIVETQKSEIKKLETTIQEAEAEKRNQRKELEGVRRPPMRSYERGREAECVPRASVLAQVISERDILGTQLIRRSEELKGLFEKIKLQQSTLKKGEIQYRERVNDVGALRDKIMALKKELGGAQSTVAHVGNLRKEVRPGRSGASANQVHVLHRELMIEQIKVTALQVRGGRRGADIRTVGRGGSLLRGDRTPPPRCCRWNSATR